MVQILNSLRLQSAFSFIPLQDRVKSNIKKLNEQSAAAGGKTDSKDAPKKPASLSPFESMLYTNLSGAIIALVFCVLTDQVRRARQLGPTLHSSQVSCPPLISCLLPQVATGLAFCQKSEVMA